MIGNDAYAEGVGPLDNPSNDVQLVAASLGRIGFDEENIAIVRNVGRAELLDAVDRHTRRLSEAGDGAIGFVYYSGHGAASPRDRRNYLIPVGVKRLDQRVWNKSVPLDEIVQKLDSAAATTAHIVIFDACRNVLKTRGKGEKGFRAMPQRRGMLIAFSTDPGETASDAGERSGPYAAALAEELVRPGLDHLQLFQNVKERVHEATLQAQLPWTQDGLVERIYFNGRITAEDQREAKAKEVWSMVRNTTDPATLEAFAQQYDGTSWASDARARAASLRRRPVISTEPPPPPEPSPPNRSPSAPRGMVRIPAGRFQMGCVPGDGRCDKDEKPRHEVYLDAYFIDRTEVTVAAYKECKSCRAPATGEACNWGRRGRDQHPVNCVSWHDAKAYCESVGKRLPTEAEWERAARGQPNDIYPWGNAAPTDRRAVFFQSDTAEVCSKGEAGHQLCDMAGNVWEWVADCYDKDVYKRSDKVTTNPLVKCSSGGRVLRGGAFYSALAWWLRASDRFGDEPVVRVRYFGFRCASPAS